MTTKSIPQYAKEESLEQLRSYYVENVINNITSKIKLDFNCDYDTINTLNDIYAPHVFYPDTTKGVRAHPIEAVGLQLGEIYLSRYKNITLSIGTNFNDLQKFRHNCYNIDGRDECRIRKQLQHEINPVNYHILNNLLNNQDSKKACAHGFGKCTIKAEYAVMNNVYDLDFNELLEGFRNHSLQILYAFMMLPDELEHKISGTNPTYGYTIEYNGKEAIQSFACGSFSYHHDYNNWHKWCTQSIIQGKYFNLAIERVKQVGPMSLLSITRVNRSIRVNTRIPNFYNDYVAIHDFSSCSEEVIHKLRDFKINPLETSSAHDKRIVREILESTRRFFLPKEVHSKVIQHCLMREDQVFRRQHVSSILKSCISRIRVAGMELQRGYELGADEFHVITMSLFIEANLMRQVETKVNGSFIEISKGDPRFHAFIEQCKYYFKKLTLGNYDYNFFDATNRRMYDLFDFKRIEILNREFSAIKHHDNEQQFITHEEHFNAYTNSGLCLDESISILRFGNTDERNLKYLHIEGDVQKALEHPEYSKVVITDNHATPFVSVRTHCKHGKGFINYVHRNCTFYSQQLHQAFLLYSSRPFEINERSEEKTKIKLNYACRIFAETIPPPKTRGFLDLFKAKTIAIDHKTIKITSWCANPGLDLDHRINKVNITHYTDSRHVYNHINNHNAKFTQNVNVTCNECYSPDEYNYFDLGLDGTDEEIVGTQIETLKCIMKRQGFFILKLQRFFSNAALGTFGMSELISIILCKKFGLFNINDANETFCTNVHEDINIELIDNYCKLVSCKDFLTLVFEAENRERDAVYNYTDSARKEQENEDSDAESDTDTFSTVESSDSPLISILDDSSDCEPLPPTITPTAPPLDDDESDDVDTQQDEQLKKENFEKLLIETDGAALRDLLPEEDKSTSSMTSKVSSVNSKKILKVFDNLIKDDEGNPIEFSYSNDENAERFTIEGYELHNSTTVTNSIKNVYDFVESFPQSFAWNKNSAFYGLTSKQTTIIMSNVTEFYKKEITLISGGGCTACESLKAFHGKDTFVVNNRITGEKRKVKDIKFGHTPFKMNITEVTSMIAALKRELSQNDSDEFHDITKAAIDTVRNIEIKNIDRKIYGFTGVPGSGKSTQAIKNCNKDTIVITPFRRLTSEYKEKGFSAFTFINAMSKDLGTADILLDEAYAMSPGIITFYALLPNKLIVIGDPLQMHNVDKANIYKGIYTRDLFDWKSLPCRNISFTVPVDVATILNSDYGYNMKTCNPIVNSIIVNDSKKMPTDELFCFTTSMERLHKSAICVAKIQGLRRKDAKLLIESSAKMLIDKIPEQMVVALSRHSEKLEVYYQIKTLLNKYIHHPLETRHACKVYGPLKFYNGREPHRFEHSKFTENENINNVKFAVELKQTQIAEHTVTNEISIKYPKEFAVNLDAFAYGYGDVDRTLQYIPELNDYLEPEELQETFKEILQEVHESTVDSVNDVLMDITPVPYDEPVLVVAEDFPKFNGLLKDVELLNDNQPCETNRFDVPLRGRPCFANNYNQSLYCAAQRYAKPKGRKAKMQSKLFAEKMYIKLLEQLEEFEGITVEDVYSGIAEQIEKINRKGDRIQCPLYNIEQFWDSTKIDFFLKQQVKADMKETPWLRLDEQLDSKAGQGISAAPKSVNLIVGGFIRAFEKKFQKSLKKENVFGYGKNSLELNSIVRTADLQHTESVEIDISEMDCQRDSYTENFLDKIYELFGVPAGIHSFMTKLNIDWILDAKWFKVLVKEHFQSGRSDTLISNTIVSMGFTFASFEIKGLKLALWQGDDVALFAMRIRNVDIQPFMKIVRTPTPTFVGYIVYDGILLDLPRMCCKLLNKNFSSNKIIAEYQLAVREWLSIIYCINKYYDCISINAFHYNISYEQSKTLLDFLFLFAAGKIFTELNTELLIRKHNYFYKYGVRESGPFVQVD